MNDILMVMGQALSAEERRDLTHWLARNGQATGLRVMGLMASLSPQPDECGLDALAWAARGGDEDAALLAGQLCSAERVDRWGGSPLHHWAEGKPIGAGAGAQIFLALGVDPAGRDQWGLLPMHWSRDPGVWAWSLAALWARGEPDGWMSCAGVGYRPVAEAMGNFGLPQWIARSRLGSAAPRFSRDNVMSNHIQLSELGEPFDADKFSVQMAQRQSALRQMEARQNCIAQKLGIELIAGPIVAQGV